MTDKLQFLYTFTPGTRPELARDPSSWTTADEAIAAAHFAYLKAATANGVVLLAGRSQDGVGPAIVILEASDEAEARDFMENDPFVAAGLFGADLHPFRIALERSHQSPVTSQIRMEVRSRESTSVLLKTEDSTARTRTSGRHVMKGQPDEV